MLEKIRITNCDARETTPPFPRCKLYHALLCVGPMLCMASLGAQAQTQQIQQTQQTQQAQTQEQTTSPDAAPAPKPSQTSGQGEAQAEAQSASPDVTPAPNKKPASTPKKAQATPAAKSGDTTLNTVVVTANRRREPAREVPMQVNVLSTDQLQKAGATSMVDYLPSQPGVNLDSGGGTGQSQISIRGVTTGTQTSPTVGVYIDNVPFGSSTLYGTAESIALDMGLLDLNHIEILRGPQGTLYGAGAMGGLLKYVTNEPDTEAFSGSVGAGFSVTENGGLNNTVNAVVNVPLKTDVAALRISAFNDHNAGYVDAVGPLAQQRVDRGDTTGARASLLLTPTDQLTVRLTATTQDVNRNGSNYVAYGADGQPVTGDLTRQLFAPEHFHQSTQLYSSDIEYDFGWARFNSITAFSSFGNSAPSDTTLDFGPLFAAQGLNFGSVVVPTISDTNKFTQEFRLTSAANQRLEWLAGLFYTDERSSLVEGLQTTLPNGAPGPDLEQFNSSSVYKEYAAYGSLTFHLTPRLALTGGIRVARNDQTFSQTTSGPLVGPATTTPGSSNDTSKTFLLTASYKLTNDSNVYVRAASGYRPGGPNVLPVNVVSHEPLPGLPSFQPDTLWTYEAGYKADLLDKRLSFEVTAYDIRWNNIQQLISVQGFNQVVNGGKADIKGLELSSTYRPTNNWNFGVNLALIDARLTEGNSLAGLVAGDRLPDTAKVAATLSGTYLFNVAGHPANAGVVERFVGQRHAGFPDNLGNPDFILPGYAITDLQANIDLKKATLSFYVRNLFDRRAFLSALTTGVPLGGPTLVSVVPPRTIGATLNVPF
jgi:iron complex outermembrane receptor protein